MRPIARTEAAACVAITTLFDAGGTISRDPDSATTATLALMQSSGLAGDRVPGWYAVLMQRMVALGAINRQIQDGRCTSISLPAAHDDRILATLRRRKADYVLVLAGETVFRPNRWPPFSLAILKPR